ncbi:Crp/Fnr family transcriptional regulator [Tenacibaculum jejuense]|uniref:Transcriptional regulator, Crp/Fnr family n=1 Tax=Tenacibaculum jejuense TaxID=584609 RepID=A0A238U7G8_9FLAO|nr:Crp/Fnr family transcriptional regulator [Tenacibaculum jejuense]SNR14330.1 Transcriptional regulator, Crp/Fnr family [Tenacibaculum jejuense]
MIAEALDNYFPELAKMPSLKNELIAISSIVDMEAGTVILKQGDYVKSIPLLVSGLAKVFKEESVNGNEVLLYYIKPGESCVMSVITLIKQQKSSVKAILEEDSKIVLIPANKAFEIAKKYPKWNEFIYDLFDLKFDELLNIIEILTFSNKNVRLLEYLKKETSLKKNNTLQTTHQQIAYELGSSREVISRLLKKLEVDGLVKLGQGKVTLISQNFS